MVHRVLILAAGVLLGLPAFSAQLLVGGASASITPDKPVALEGQMVTRIAAEVESPVVAEALAIEAVEDGAIVDQAIFVACDLVAIRAGILERVRERLSGRLQGFDLNKLVLSATHTHTAPVTELDRYTIEGDEVMRPEAYIEFLSDRIADAAEAAWQKRVPARVGWGMAYAVVAYNRRSVYANESAQMYGKTNEDTFRMLEGYEDHGVEVLFFWNESDSLIATAVNVACPAQEVESRSAVNADFWHPIRAALREKHGEGLTILGWTGASGDQSPHLMYRKAAENRMRELRGLDRLEEITRRVVAAWGEAYEGAAKDKHSDVAFAHHVATINLPVRTVLEDEYTAAKSNLGEAAKDPFRRWRAVWFGSVVDRYEAQQAGTQSPYEMELHTLRLGDVAIATNAFELFTDYGIQMKARSRALQTFIIQLAGPGTYLPTARAVHGGGYSAVVESSVVGPEGGQVLVEHTLESLHSLFPETD